MICQVCGQFSEPDRESGYDADSICPACVRKGWTEQQIDGQTDYINERHAEELAALTQSQDPRR